MKLNILNARIRRSNLKEYSKNYFRDDTSQIIINLNEEGKQALVGIQKENEVYTIIGEKYVYFSTCLKAKGEIPLRTFSNILYNNSIKKGKLFSRYKYVKINNNQRVWLNNKLTMSAILNIILWLEKSQENN